jgi:hypothetical protein
MSKFNLSREMRESSENRLFIFLITILAGCNQPSSQPSTDANQPSVNVSSSPTLSTDLSQGFDFKTPSKWEGVAEVKLGNQIVKNPVWLEISSAKSQGQNPFNFYINIGDRDKLNFASVLLYSGMDVTTSSGGSVFLEYYQIQTTPSGFQAVLTKEQQLTGTSYNSFIGPVLSSNPGNPFNSVIERIREETGNKISYIFRPGMQLTVNYQQGILIGKISGTGFMSGLESTAGDLPCEVVFQVKRVT